MANKLDEAWLDFNADEKTEKYRDLFSKNSWINGKEPMPHEPCVIGCDLLVEQRHGVYTRDIIINEWLKKEGRSVQVIEGEDYSVGNFILRYQLENGEQPLYSPNALARRLAKTTHELRNNNQLFLLGFPGNFDLLYLN